MGCELTGQEAVKLHEQLEVDIVTLGGLAVSASHVVSVEIDTYYQNLIVSLCSCMLIAISCLATEICCAESRSLRELVFRSFDFRSSIADLKIHLQAKARGWEESSYPLLRLSILSKVGDTFSKIFVAEFCVG